jgi:hypothetical protein
MTESYEQELERVKDSVREAVACGCCSINYEAVSRVATWILHLYSDVEGRSKMLEDGTAIDVYNFVVFDRSLPVYLHRADR